jgi:hypothetical protein
MKTTNELGAKNKWLALLALAGFAAFAGACDRSHLSSY